MQSILKTVKDARYANPDVIETLFTVTLQMARENSKDEALWCLALFTFSRIDPQYYKRMIADFPPLDSIEDYQNLSHVLYSMAVVQDYDHKKYR